MSREFQTAAVPVVLVRFEQARGLGGVPKVWLVFMATTQIGTLVRQAVESLRAFCIESHGRDLMPWSDDQYRLHNVDGGMLTSIEEIAWETVNGQNRAELVLTWGLPSERLAVEQKNG